MSDNLDDLGHDDLYELAKAADIKGRTKLSDDELRDALRAAGVTVDESDEPVEEPALAVEDDDETAGTPPEIAAPLPPEPAPEPEVVDEETDDVVVDFEERVRRRAAGIPFDPDAQIERTGTDVDPDDPLPYPGYVPLTKPIPVTSIANHPSNPEGT